MALAYVPPGVTVREVVTPSVNPLLATPANVCIVGPSQGYVEQTDLVTLTNEDNIRLPRLPDGATLNDPIVSVTNINDVNVGYVETSDFVVVYSGSVNEVQTVTIAGTGVGGTFTLSFNGQTTAAIAYNAATSAVETALEDLANIEAADVAVTGSAGAYVITFGGQYADTNVNELTADGTGLSGTVPTVTVATPTEGGVTGTIRRDDAGDIEEGETVQVTYRYVPENYYSATRLDEPSTIEDLYGPALDTDGNISSLVSYAAQCAFENGARDLIIAPLFVLDDAQDPESDRLAPTPAEIQDAATWGQTLVGLREIEDINVIVPAIGQSFPGLIDSEQYAIFAKIQDHVKYMADQQQYVVAILGEDSSVSSSVASRDTLRAHVASLKSRHGGVVNEQTVLLNTSKLSRVNSATGATQLVGGQYAAAGFAGMLASRAVSSTLTREVISGFTAVADVPPRTKADKNRDANEGLCVLENRGDVVWIRHATTTDTTATQRREISVVRAKHRMVESVRDTLETQVIGKVIADGRAPAVVAAAVGSVLESLKTVGDLVDYKDIQARTLTLDPTTVEVRFSYRPAFPLNYINIQFSIDLTSDGGVATV